MHGSTNSKFPRGSRYWKRFVNAVIGGYEQI